MGVLYLSEEEVCQLLDMRSAVAAVEEAFRQLGQGGATNVPRSRAQAKGIVLHGMSAAADYLGLVGWKNYVTTRESARFLVGIYTQDDGRLVGLFEADHLGRMRTGAATAVATEWLAKPEATEMGLFGTGRQAETQLAGVAAVRKLRRVFVYSRTPERRESFARRMSEQLDIEVTAVDRPQEAAEELPIVVTATTSRTPVFDGNALSEDCFVAAIGSNWLQRAEIDDVVIRRADSIVCDSIEACQCEAGDFVSALEKGIFDWSLAVDLADVVCGRHAGRKQHDSICLFKSVGLAIEDLAVAALVYQRAQEKGLGRMIEL